MPEARRLYWLGNAAKSRIVDDILATQADGRRIRVFDYGCGDGGDWPSVLADNPTIELTAYDPDPESSAVAEGRLRPAGVSVVPCNAIGELKLQADVIVSFSVFEHVYDRGAYLRTAKRLLARDGTFYLNYDDGHFRVNFDVDSPRRWPGEMLRVLHNVAAPALPSIGQAGRFQARVGRNEADALIGDVGLTCLRSFYSNLESFKMLFPSIPGALREDFCRLWLDVETDLNQRFLEPGPIQRGDSVNLWGAMASRTLVLAHAAR